MCLKTKYQRSRAAINNFIYVESLDVSDGNDVNQLLNTTVFEYNYIEKVWMNVEIQFNYWVDNNTNQTVEF